MTTPNLNDIPTALRQRPQWVVWRYEARDKGGKPTKVPYQAMHPQRKASSNGPQTWASVEEALDTAQRYKFDGVGFVFSPDDPFVGFDLDDVLDERGRVADWASAWLHDIPTYTEVSPSGKGLKGIAIGKLPGSGVNAGSVEMYDQGRYFAITGQRYDGAPAEPRPVNGAIDRLYAFAQEQKAQYEAEREHKRKIAYAAAALKNETERVKTAPEGTRNDALNRAAFALATFLDSGLLEEDEIVNALADAAGLNGLGPAEIRGTLRSGMTAGKLNPRTIQPSVNVATGEIVTSTPTQPIRRVEHILDIRQHGIDAASLQKLEFPPLYWTVDAILPEGATLLAGKPKSKKSWKALGVAVAVAMGEKVLNYFDALKGEVLYLDLESNQRRMKSRLAAILGARPWPATFHIYTKWERGEAGIALLDGWMVEHPSTKLVVIDIFQNFRPARDPKGNPYDQDYEAIKMINEFAERHRISVLVIHHTRKAKADDVFDEISGTTGLSGGVASMWVLGRTPDNSGESVLAIRGRDISDDEPMILKWDAYTCQFVMVATGQDASSSSARRAILDVMEMDQEYQLKDIAAAVGKPINATSNQMRRLMDDNLVQRVGNGRYARVPPRISYSRVSGVSRVSDEGGVSGVSGWRDITPDLHDLHRLTHEKSVSLEGSDMPQSGDFSRLTPLTPRFNRDDFSVDCVEVDGRQVWRLWDDVTNTELGQFPTEAEALADAERRCA